MDTQISSSGERYIGELKDGIRHGNGILIFPSGEKYVGEFKDGLYHGNGIHTFPNRDNYIGEFKNGKRNGNGAFIHFIGINYSRHEPLTFHVNSFIEEKYVGEFLNDLYHGIGTLIFSDGEKYVGEFQNNVYHGEGTLTFLDGTKYIGEFQDGNYHGNGNSTSSDGELYVGEFKHGIRNGKGTLTFPNGENYVGEFKDGRYHGKGTLTKSNGTKYIGEFMNGRYHGNAVYTWSGGKYVGEFKLGLWCGNGTLIGSSGEKYVGEFKNMEYNGKGTLTLPDGTKYVGEFSGGLFHGNGTLTFPDGDEEVGEFHEGNFVPLENLILALSNKNTSNSDDINNRTYLFFDTETTGLPKNYKAPVADLNNWPRLVQIAFLLYDYYGNKILEGDYIIKPNGFSIPIEASRIHGITTERANREGKSLSEVLHQFYDLVEKADCIVAHNMQFDEKIVGAEFLRNNMHNNISAKSKICTMESTTDFCAIKGPYGNKWPTLSELHNKLFGTGFEEAHNAAVDINATAKCFWELKRLGVFK